MTPTSTVPKSSGVLEPPGHVDVLLICEFSNAIHKQVLLLIDEHDEVSLEGNKDHHEVMEQHMDGAIAQAKERGVHGLGPLLCEHHGRVVSLLFFKTGWGDGFHFSGVFSACLLV